MMAAILLDQVGLATLDESEWVNFITVVDGHPMWCHDGLEQIVDFLLPLLAYWGVIDSDCNWTGQWRTEPSDPIIPGTIL